MADYKLREGGVIRTADWAQIPDNNANRDWREYQRWLAAGNTPDPADPVTPFVDGQAEIELAIANATSLPQLKTALLGTEVSCSGRNTTDASCDLTEGANG